MSNGGCKKDKSSACVKGISLVRFFYVELGVKPNQHRKDRRRQKYQSDKHEYDRDHDELLLKRGRGFISKRTTA